jgi:IS1 family transposase
MRPELMFVLHILFGALITSGDYPCHSGRQTVLRRWRLLRLDDNGNSFVVDDYQTYSEALDAQRCYEKKGHKQTYWVEKNPTD